MSRLTALAGRPRQTLGALAVVLVAVGVAVGSGANFTAHSATAGNTFATGTLTISAPGTAVLTATNMKPGDVRTGTAIVQNTGTVTGNFTLNSSNAAGYTALLAQLDLNVQDCGDYSAGTPTCDVGDPSVYTGTVSGLNGAVLGNWAAAEKHMYKFTTTLPVGTNDTFQGRSSTLEFDWDAISG